MGFFIFPHDQSIYKCTNIYALLPENLWECLPAPSVISLHKVLWQVSRIDNKGPFY